MVDSRAANQQIIPSGGEEEEDEDKEYGGLLEGFSMKERKRNCLIWMDIKGVEEEEVWRDIN